MIAGDAEVIAVLYADHGDAGGFGFFDRATHGAVGSDVSETLGGV